MGWSTSARTRGRAVGHRARPLREERGRRCLGRDRDRHGGAVPRELEHRVLGEGDYQLRVIALDRAGNEAVSRLVPVRVERLVAAVKLVDPANASPGPSASAPRCATRRRSPCRVPDRRRRHLRLAGAGRVLAAALRARLRHRAGEDGTYDLRAVARDQRGGIDASRICRGPPDRQHRAVGRPARARRGGAAPRRVPLSARASDTGSGVKSAVFQFSGDGATWRPVLTRGEPAGAVYWDTTRVGDGDYQLRAVVGDGAGNITLSDAIAVRIDNTPPSVALVEPAPAPIWACDPARGLGVRRRLRRDRGALRVVARRRRLGEVATVAAEPYATVWDTNGVTDGVCRLRVVARDRAGNGVFSEPVELTVRNKLVFEPLESLRPEVSETVVRPRRSRSPSRRARRSRTRSACGSSSGLLETEAMTHERREELEAILFTLRPYARPDGSIPTGSCPCSGRRSGSSCDYHCPRGVRRARRRVDALVEAAARPSPFMLHGWLRSIWSLCESPCVVVARQEAGSPARSARRPAAGRAAGRGAHGGMDAHLGDALGGDARALVAEARDRSTSPISSDARRSRLAAVPACGSSSGSRRRARPRPGIVEERSPRRRGRRCAEAPQARRRRVRARRGPGRDLPPARAALARAPRRLGARAARGARRAARRLPRPGRSRPDPPAVRSTAARSRSTARSSSGRRCTRTGSASTPPTGSSRRGSSARSSSSSGRPRRASTGRAPRGGEEYKLQLADRLEPLHQAFGLATGPRARAVVAARAASAAARRRLKRHRRLHRFYVDGLAPARRAITSVYSSR